LYAAGLHIFYDSRDKSFNTLLTVSDNSVMISFIHIKYMAELYKDKVQADPEIILTLHGHELIPTEKYQSVKNDHSRLMD
jgi:hypothetical protein